MSETETKTVKAEVGLVVKLKSGGPLLTVAKVPEAIGSPITCHWFADGKLQTGEFERASLKLDDNSRNIGFVSRN